MTDVVTREVKIQAAPQVVFEYFTDPEKAKKWNAHSAELDPRPGGIYRLEAHPGMAAVGEFVELDPPNRLVYTWGWEGSTDIPPGSTTVEISLEADGDYTLLRLTHRGLPTAETRASHSQGWEHYLARLAIAASGGDAGPDPWAEGKTG